MDKTLLVLAGAVLCQSFWGVVIADHWVGAVVMVPLAILAISMAGGLSMTQPTARRRSTRTPRVPRVDHESVEQMALIRWLYGEQQRGEPVGALFDVIYHPPNGGQRNKKTAVDLKRQGVKSGVSDLVVMEGRGGWFGLYVEFKATPPNHAATAASQKEWLEKADRRGYCAVLARGLEEAKAVLREYASWPPTVIERRESMTVGTKW